MYIHRYVDHVYEGTGFQLVHGGKVADIFVCPEDYPGVVRAANDLKLDVNRVAGMNPETKNDISTLSVNAVIIGTIGKSPVIDRLIDEGKLDAADLRGKWEAFVIQVVPEPVPGVEMGLIIAGSDKRGTIFGIYDLSEQMGVSPWYWWADVPTPHKDTLVVSNGVYKQGEPSVKYRGIFINDEGPSMMDWVRSNYRDFVHEFYEKVFELILRLKGNFLWPAMWDSAFNEDDPLNPVLADEYGIVVGTSHHEPMLRSHGEWKTHKKGSWDYSKNEEFLYKFWEYGIERNKDYESIITLGMRGDGDEAMGGTQSFEDKIRLLQKIVDDQRKIIADKMNPDVTKVPQLWALYKEVQDYYESGMRVPEDITLLWSDDNFGNLRRVPTEEERKRPGGAGIYYHCDYVGGPRSYKWINTVPLQKIWEQMHKAYAYGADRIWILNVGDLKPMEFPMEYFLRMAWNVNQFTKDNFHEYSVMWAERQFGRQYAEDIVRIIAGYTKYNGRLKPEHINMVDLYSPTNYKEADTVLADFHEITALAERIYEELPENLKDAFFELVLHPVKASSLVTEVHINAEKNNLYADQKRATANVLAGAVELAFEADDELTFDYNQRLAFGKWNHMMDQTHIGYTYWNYPPQNIMPAVQRVDLQQGSEMGIAVEGSAKAWPSARAKCVLPQFSNFIRESRYIDIFNKKSDPFVFTAEADASWIKLSLSEGLINQGKRIWVDIDWDTAPKGQPVNGSIRISSSCGDAVTVHLAVFNPVAPERESLKGFIENDGYVSIEAEHYTDKKDIQGVGWEKIDGYGRTLSSMAVFPVTAKSVIPPENSPCLEYQVYLVNPGDIKVSTLMAPSLDFVPGQGLRLGVSFDDQPIQMVDAVKKKADGSFCEKDWSDSVTYNIREAETTHHVEGAGYHTLKIWMVDPIVVLQKIIIKTATVKPSYLGPAESYYGGKPQVPAPLREGFFDPSIIPGRIQAVHYNTGANGSAYFSLSKKNAGVNYRNDEIDIGRCGDSYIVRNLEKGEWLEYDVFVEHSGIYEVELAAYSGRNRKPVIHFECDGRDITGAMDVSPAGDIEKCITVKKTGIALEAGNHVLKLCVDEAGLDLGRFEFISVQRDIFVVRPTLRCAGMLPDRALTAQIGLFNTDMSAHSFAMTVSLFDQSGNLLDSAASTGTVPRNRKEMYNYCFKHAEGIKVYRLKVALIYDGAERVYDFELAAPRII